MKQHRGKDQGHGWKRGQAAQRQVEGPIPRRGRHPDMLTPCGRYMGLSVRYFGTDVFAWLAALTDGDTQTER